MTGSARAGAWIFSSACDSTPAPVAAPTDLPAAIDVGTFNFSPRDGIVASARNPTFVVVGDSVGHW